MFYQVKRSGATWSIYRMSDGVLVEGGYFSRTIAMERCAEYNNEAGDTNAYAPIVR